MAAEQLSPRKRLLFATAAAGLSVGLVAIGLLAVDVYLHRKYERQGSVNVWGYRGPAVGRKQPDEVRLVVLGGSSAFGYGPDWDGSFPYLLEQQLRRRGAFSVVNLGYNNESAYSFRYTLEDYDYIDYDIAIFYEGYNDLGEIPRYQVIRRDSAIFRLTGYFPIFPVVFREKAFALMNDGDIAAGYRRNLDAPGNRTAFQPGLAKAVAATALDAAVDTADALERQLGRLTRDLSDANTVTPNSGCRDQWAHYCGAIYDGIVWARARGRGLIVVTQPYISDRHIDQQNALAGMLQARFGADAGVRYVNLGTVLDLRNRKLAYDGMHLSAEGNQVIASHLLEPVVQMTAMVAR